MEKDHIKRLISSLNRLRVRYAFTVAFAVSHYGFPRSSADIDILDMKKLEKMSKEKSVYKKLQELIERG